MDFSRENLLRLIEKNRLAEVIEEMKEISERIGDVNLKNEVILISSKYKSLQKSIRIGILSNEEIRINQSKIRLALIEMVGELSGENSFNKLQPQGKGSIKSLRFILVMCVTSIVLSLF